MLELLAGLHEEVAAAGVPGCGAWSRDAHGDAAAGVACPNVQAGIPRTSVDGEEIEVRVETCEDSVFDAVFFEI